MYKLAYQFGINSKQLRIKKSPGNSNHCFKNETLAIFD